MKPQHQFALALRIIGVLGLIYILRAFVRVPSPQTLSVIARVVCTLMGAYLIRGAPLLVKFAYPESAEPTPQPSAKPNP
jgi:hypothetical protein